MPWTALQPYTPAPLILMGKVLEVVTRAMLRVRQNGLGPWVYSQR